MPKRSKTRKTAEMIEAERIAKRARDLEAAGVTPEAAILPRQDDIEVTREGAQREGRKVDSDQARRLDAFSALRTGMAAGAYDAARRFELDLLTRHGMADKGNAIGRIDCTAGHTTDLSLTAGIMVEKVQDRIPPRDFWLLCELIVPPVDRGTWRDHVNYICGEKHSEAQAACVRSACVNLRDAYAAMERKAA